MSFEVSNRVWAHSKATQTELLALVAMADWADPWGYCHPTIDQIAARCRQTPRNITNVLGALERSGEVRCIACGRGGRGKTGSGSVYQVLTGLTPTQIQASEMASPLCRTTLARLQNGEMLPSKPRLKSGENFSGEKQIPQISGEYQYGLNSIKNTSDIPTSTTAAAINRIEQVYLMIRPTQITMPRGEKFADACAVVDRYIKKFGDSQVVAAELARFAAEADARGINSTNLCWLTEWAATGAIPQRRTKPARGGHHTSPQSNSEKFTPVDQDALARKLLTALAENEEAENE